jgi:hypothetical protein
MNDDDRIELIMAGVFIAGVFIGGLGLLLMGLAA